MRKIPTKTRRSSERLGAHPVVVIAGLLAGLHFLAVPRLAAAISEGSLSPIKRFSIDVVGTAGLFALIYQFLLTPLLVDRAKGVITKFGRWIARWLRLSEFDLVRAFDFPVWLCLALSLVVLVASFILNF
jgi:hypothetical protein